MIDRDELFARAATADDDLLAAQLVEVEGVQRLAALHQDVVRDVDDVVDRLVDLERAVLRFFRKTVWRRSMSHCGEGPALTLRITQATYCGRGPRTRWSPT